MSTDLGADLFLDARPDPDFRLFVKARVLYPYDQPEIRELFSDFNLGRVVFVRVGKQALRTGVGYYFSPADFLSLGSIDPENPTADRTGPTGVKAAASVGPISLTTVVTVGGETPDALGVFGQLEGVWGGWEWATAVSRQDYQPLRAMVSATGNLGSLQTFAEVVASQGSTRQFVRLSGDGPEVYEKDRWLGSWTAGFRYTDQETDLTFTAQLYHNGEGYEDSEALAQAQVLVAQGELRPADLSDWGRWQSGIGLQLKDWGGSDLSVSSLWMSDWSDRSGRVIPQISYSWDEHVSLALAFPWSYGRTGSVYAPQSQQWGVQLTCGLGAGAF